MDIPDGWTRSEDGKAIARTLVFADFAAAFAFLTRVAEAAERVDHHPDFALRWNRVELTLSSHDVDALTGRDVALAHEINGIAEQAGVQAAGAID